MTDDPDDPGGLTKFGLSKRANPDLDIASLTHEQAVDVYFARYYAPPGFLKLSPEHAEPLFDLSVHAGASQAIILAQRAVGQKEDGVLGQRTASAITGSPTFRHDFAVERIVFYTKVILARPTSMKYARGWTRRALALI
jgi:lysozyme family protein